MRIQAKETASDAGELQEVCSDRLQRVKESQAGVKPGPQEQIYAAIVTEPQSPLLR